MKGLFSAQQRGFSTFPLLSFEVSRVQVLGLQLSEAAGPLYRKQWQNRSSSFPKHTLRLPFVHFDVAHTYVFEALGVNGEGFHAFRAPIET